MSEVSPFGGKHPILGVVLAAIAGILLADVSRWSFATSLLLVLGAGGLWLAIRRTFTLLLLAASLFFLLHALQFDRNPARQLAASLGGAELTVTGSGLVDSVPTVLTSSGGKVRSTFQLNHASLLVQGRRWENLSLLINWPNSAPGIGDRLSFEGNLANLAPPRNPGEFDYAAWLARRQILSLVVVPLEKNARVTQHAAHWNPRRLAGRIKSSIAEIITRDLRNSPVEAGVISAIMLGAKDDTPDSTLELFMKTGTFHLFSVSGLHVSMLAGITLFILVTVRIPRRTALLLSIPIVFTYAFITGWSASSVRAAIMTSAFVLATLLDRRSLSMNTLAAACFLILYADTNQLFSTGFQLSFAVVASIILLSGPLTRRLQKLTRPDPFIPRKLLTPVQKGRWLLSGKASAALALTITAWLGSLPLTACYFNLLSPVALVANLLIVPLSSSILTLGVLSLLSALAGGWAVVAFNNVSWALVKLLLILLGFFSSLPGGSLFVGPHWWQRAERQRITFFDLGGGAATVLETSRGCWLIDCGSESDYRRIVRHYLQQRGINRVEGIFLTHADGSHVGAIPHFLTDFPDSTIYAPLAGRGSLGFRRLQLPAATHWLAAPTSLALDRAASLKLLWPPTEVDGGRADDHCSVIRLTVAGQNLLLTSDAGFTTEMNLLAGNTGAELRADWLVLGRHRDDPGGTKGFFKKVGAPQILATAAIFPTSEKLPPAWSSICRELGLHLLRFDQTGAVQIEWEKNQPQVKTFFAP